MTHLPHAQAATVEQVEGDKVTLRLPNDQLIDWSLALLDEEVTKGDTVHVLVFGQVETEKERERLARHVLSEMLKG